MNDTPPSKFLSPDVAATRHHLVRIVAAVPILVFLGIAALLAVRLGVDNPSLVPSALIGRPVPQFALAPLEGFATSGPPGLSTADLKAGHVTLVNVFASWCVECHNEHEALMALSREPALRQRGVKLTGIIYKDDPGRARSYLNAKGNPFAQVGIDPSGRTGIDFGLYGVPETYVVKGNGTIAYKLVGGISDATRPALMAAIASAQPP